MLSTRIEEAVLASCKSGRVGCSGREEEERGVEREKELEVGVDANRRLFAGGTGSLEVRMGEDAKDWEREESEGGMKGFANFGGGFEVEALAFIARRDGLNKSRLADHMTSRGGTRLGSRGGFASLSPGLGPLTRYASFFRSRIFLTVAIVSGGRVREFRIDIIGAGCGHLPNLGSYCFRPPAIESGQ